MSYNVLVVDDSSFMRTLLTSILKHAPGVGEIHQAVNGVEATEIYKEKRPDLVTMDIDMPEMNGIAAAEAIRKVNPFAKIVMVTSSDKTDTREAANKIGVEDYIKKPFNRGAIIEMVQRLF